MVWRLHCYVIRHDARGRRAVTASLPRMQCPPGRRPPQIEEAPADFIVKRPVGGEPAVWPGFAPERQHIGRRDVVRRAHLPLTLAVQAAAFFSSRNSRRRILPTLVLGSEVLNSICFGTL